MSQQERAERKFWESLRSEEVEQSSDSSPVGPSRAARLWAGPSRDGAAQGRTRPSGSGFTARPYEPAQVDRTADLFQ